jgi:SAM-dependent methyltransferase
MRPGALAFLVCPHCGGALTLDARVRDGDEIVEGRLDCGGCGAAFPITGGVPRFVPGVVLEEARRTVDRFGQQWEEFNFITDEYEQQFLAWIAPNTRETFHGQVVLDAGCGKGRHTMLAARFGARDVIAVDLSCSVDTAYWNTRRFENVHVVQADLFHLPLAPAVIDVAFSIGVVHHTPDPGGAFAQLVRLLKPGARIIVWVYAREGNEWVLRFVDPLRRAVTSRLPHRWLYHLSKPPAAILYAASRGIYRPLSRPPLDILGRRLFYQAYLNAIAMLPFRDVHLIVHDHLGPAIARYIAHDEFETWFRAAGLTDVSINWHNRNSWRGTAVKPRAQVSSCLDVGTA